MNELWKTFSDAYHQKVKKDNLELIYIVEKYVHFFQEHCKAAFSSEQKEVMNNVLFLLLEKGEKIEKLDAYFGFIFPTNDINLAKEAHEKTLALVSKSKSTSLKDKIMACVSDNEIPEELVTFMEQEFHSIDSFILVLSFSYLMNKSKTLFPKDRTKILSLYAKRFTAVSIHFPKSLFVTTDIESLHIFSVLDKEKEHNMLLNLSFTILRHTTFSHLRNYIEEIKRVYEEIRDIFQEAEKNLFN